MCFSKITNDFRFPYISYLRRLYIQRSCQQCVHGCKYFSIENHVNCVVDSFMTYFHGTFLERCSILAFPSAFYSFYTMYSALNGDRLKAS